MAFESVNNPLDISDDRIREGKRAGDEHTGELESIRDVLDKDDNSGTALGTMVSMHLEVLEGEARYSVRQGIPTKDTKAVKAAAGDVKSA